MTVGQIATKVAWFFNRVRSDFLDVNGEDLIVDAMNMVRVDAERMRDFTLQEAQAYMSIDPANGGDLSTLKLMSGDTATQTKVRFKTVSATYLQDTTNTQIIYPLLIKPKVALERTAEEYLYRYNAIASPVASWETPLVRYPGDITQFNRARVFVAYWQGQRIFLDPRPQVAMTMLVDGNFWMTPYFQNRANVSVTSSSTASPTVTLAHPLSTTLKVGQYLLGQQITAIVDNVSDTTITLAGNANATIGSATDAKVTDIPGVTNNEDWEDWMTANGSDYLLYGTICQINFQQKAFVPRQDGFMAPPEKYRDSAFQSLRENDAFSMNAAFRGSFLQM